MLSPSLHLIRTLVTLSSALTLFACQSGQTDKGPLVEFTPPRPSITFKPFHLNHPETGQRLGPQTWMRLPDGSRMQAGEYYGALSPVEYQLNVLGFSLFRDDPEQIAAELQALALETQKYGKLVRGFEEKRKHRLDLMERAAGRKQQVSPESSTQP